MSIKLKVVLDSDTILTGQKGTNNKVAALMDTSLGLPYIDAHTLKGTMRKGLEELKPYLSEVNLGKIIETLFGTETCSSKLQLSHCNISTAVAQHIGTLIAEGVLTSDELKQALVTEQYNISINSKGTAKDGSLRTTELVNKGLVFYSEVTENLTQEELEVLALGCITLRSLGARSSRGAGAVTVSLLINDKDVTADYVKGLEKRVS